MAFFFFFLNIFYLSRWKMRIDLSLKNTTDKQPIFFPFFFPTKGSLESEMNLPVDFEKIQNTI